MTESLVENEKVPIRRVWVSEAAYQWLRAKRRQDGRLIRQVVDDLVGLSGKVRETVKQETTTEGPTVKKAKVVKDKPVFTVLGARLIEVFREFNPGLPYNRPAERRAADALIERFGFDETVSMARKAYEAQTQDRYCPRAVTPAQLLEKLGALSVYFKSRESAVKNKIVNL